MHCFFMRSGRIAGVEELPGLSDEEAVEKSRSLFASRRAQFAYDGFEVWERARVVTQHPPIEDQKPEGEVIPFSPQRRLRHYLT
jgi:hypothetical protein